MKKYIKFLSVFALLLIFSPSLTSFALLGEDVPVKEQVLVFDHDNHNAIPDNFRMTTTKLTGTNLNLTGLSTLNISGSQQYSQKGLCLVKEKLPKDKNLIFVDLRQESHGFINGLPISWEGNGDKANEGLSHAQVIARNDAQLASIPLNKPITISGKTITPHQVYSEDKLITQNKNTYLRVTVTDTKLPTLDMVDYFVSFVNKAPKNSWYHFHCKEGIGRTTTFMIMYDMMHNAKNVPLNDIVLRQIKLANLESKEKGLEDKERMAFFEKFYAYCKKGNFNQKFSTFK